MAVFIGVFACPRNAKMHQNSRICQELSGDLVHSARLTKGNKTGRKNAPMSGGNILTQQNSAIKFSPPRASKSVLSGRSNIHNARGISFSVRVRSCEIYFYWASQACHDSVAHKRNVHFAKSDARRFTGVDGCGPGWA